MSTKTIAVFPGTFDPVTKGHLDIVARGAQLFDEVVVAIGVNTKKTTLFDLDQRTKWLEETFSVYSNVRIDRYEGLTVDFCEKIGAKFLLRGLRNGSDFDYESHIAQLNKDLSNGIETIFILSSPELSYISSTLVRDLILHKGKYQRYMPDGLSGI
jgi:pantetheine-phosphate adenylyltransferase